MYWRLLSAITLCLLGTGCGTRWVQITGASAASSEAVEVELGLNTCRVGYVVPADDVEETTTEVRIRLSIAQPSGDRDDCLTPDALVRLAAPIGDRVVVDDRTGRRFEVSMP